MRLKDKVAVVTGAGQGMGRAIAQRFAREGASVVAIDLNFEAASQTIGSGIGRAIALDISDAAAVNAAFPEIIEQFGRVDLLVNNAGTGAVDAFADIPDAHWACLLYTSRCV